MKCLWLAIFFSVLFGAKAQTDLADSSDENAPIRFVKPILNEVHKGGVILGIGLGTMFGTELKNPTPSMVLTGGVYYRYRFQQHWSLQPAATVSFRGSSFNNKPTEYGQIKTVNMDIPLLLLHGLNEQNTKNILMGLQFSRQLSATIYEVDALLPYPETPKLNVNELALVMGAQFQTPFVGFQILAKVGLNDLNNGLLPNIKPANSGGTIHQAGLEVNLLF